MIQPVTPASVALSVIIGPTAGGKSALAMQLAERFNLAIIGADSRHVYGGFDIGTAKPSSADRTRVPHFGIDVIAPTEPYSAYQWAHDATGWCRDAERSGRAALIVGGTGFYVRALVKPFDSPALEVDRRAMLTPFLAALDSRELARWCQRLDPQRAELGPTQRLRAVETVLLSGRRISDWSGASTALEHHAVRTVRYLVVDPGGELHHRIEVRVQAMLTAGWQNEVRDLMARVPADAPAWKASGYQAMRDAVRGARSHDDAVQRILAETRQYAKRQRTWCRHQLPLEQVTRLDSSAANAFALACAWWESDTGNHA